ncbi:type III-B CRISPR-associated protein Cas10/Cmr2 [Thioflexithrix psekupsensis]|uniref:Type III-B CRISPR-associated protein Cas10/Cmr2 n=1 Tax=Thioflexithrix psekupsensis TaxID=1570016 RepID=A0A251X9C1_9GAMM|nr:type III-B CRISPR-associated protein Cas10/Cmr2 [Thioflexithrix psekupsensis]OUD14540.1 type III-B CRISPR-associated protein Cas10/Cmr2 [Thioflexithrix psekupsensis]
MKYLFLFTHSPVQSFIAQARKTHDLWAGSRILSELTKTAGKFFEKKGAKIIYPYDLESKSLSNRVLGEIEITAESELLKQIGEEAEQAVRECFRKIADDAFNKACGKRFPKPAGFDEQIEQHLDIRWLFYPIEENYVQAYQNLSELAAAMKNSRDFAQFGKGQGEQGRNCSLDGSRNALFYRPHTSGKRLAYLPKQAVELSPKYEDIPFKFLKPGEALSAISLSKRYYRHIDSFPRTSAVALMDYFEKIKGNDLRNLFSKDEFDEELYFEENLTPKYFQQEGLELHLLDKVKSIIDKLPKPTTRYYALLAFDGDNMGKWLSGEFLELKNESELHSFHQKFSEKLADFAKYASDYLEPPRGQSVYAGGDDFLGFINLTSLFSVLEQLRSKFEELVNVELEKQFKLKYKMTFSAGVVVSHYRTPLHIVLQQVRCAEKDAKKSIRPDDKAASTVDSTKNSGKSNQVIDKDALTINLMKRSGESNQAILPWYHGDVFVPNELKKVIDGLSNGFSDTFARRLAAEFQNPSKQTHQGMFLSELHRLIIRAAPEGLGREKTQCEIKQLYDTLKFLLEAEKILWGQSSEKINHDVLNNFIETLKVAMFLQRHIKSSVEEISNADSN